MAATCNFGSLQDELVRDRTVCGISSIKVQQKLLQEPKLTLNRCIDIARSAETTTAQLKVITGQTEDASTEVHAVGKLQRTHNQNVTRRNTISDGKYCGGTYGWKKGYCPAFGKMCDHCGKRNHFAALCLKRMLAREIILLYFMCMLFLIHAMILSVLIMMHKATYTSTQFPDPNISPRFLLK